MAWVDYSVMHDGHDAERLGKLRDELWEIMMSDGGEALQRMNDQKRAIDRRGYAKRLLVKCIDRSSLGIFNGSIYFFAGKLYESISRAALRKVVFDVIESRMMLSNSDLCRLSDIYYDCENAVYARTLHVSNSVMVFRNGVLDVETGKFHRRFDRRFVQMWAVDYDYNPKAVTFLWRQFIDQVLPEKELQEVLQMFLGATFIDRRKVKIEHILILLGHGANGKSVVQNAVKGVLGPDYVSEQSIGKLCSRGIEGELAAAEINGKRLNYCTEMEVTDFFKKTARLKAIVSGERVTARQLYNNPYYVSNVPLLMANANQIPVFNKEDEAMLRRLYVIPFRVTIPEERQNKSLGSELEAEYPAILNWILEGRQKFIDNGYRLPQELSSETYIMAEHKEYNTALAFMTQKMNYKPKLKGVTMMPQRWITVKELYLAYQRWCIQNERECYSKIMFVSSLVDEGGFKRQRKSAGVSIAVYGGAEFEKNKRRHAMEKNRTVDGDDVKHIWKDGVLYVFSLISLAKYAGVGVSMIRTLNNKGMFHPHTKAYKGHAAYDVEKCIEVMRNNNVIATDYQKQLIAKLGKQRTTHRKLYNDWCQRYNWPYRMYSRTEEQLEDDIKVVPDDTTFEETIEMAKRDGYDVSTVLKGRGRKDPKTGMWRVRKLSDEK